MTREQRAEVLVYSTAGCPFCIMAKQLLDRLGISYEDKDLSSHPDRFSFIDKIHPGQRTVPLILIDGKAIGGHVDLEKLHAQGELLEKIFADRD